MTAQPTSAIKENDSVVSNGNGNGNGRFWAGIVNIATSGVLLAVFVIWWQTANPGPRLDKIETDQRDLRRELIGSYLSLREHEEFQTRAAHITATMEKRLEDFRGYYIAHEDRFSKLSDTFVTRNECSLRAQKDEKLFDITQSRIDRLYNIIDDLSKRISSTRESVLSKDQSKLPQK